MQMEVRKSINNGGEETWMKVEWMKKQINVKGLPFS